MRAVIVGVVAGVVVAGCGGATEPSAGAATTTSVVLRDFAFKPRTLELPAGKPIVLELRNAGTVEHDLDLPALGLHGHLTPGQTLLQKIGPLPVGKTYQFECTLPGHKQLGMTGLVVVK